MSAGYLPAASEGASPGEKLLYESMLGQGEKSPRVNAAGYPRYVSKKLRHQFLLAPSVVVKRHAGVELRIRRGQANNGPRGNL